MTRDRIDETAVAISRCQAELPDTLGGKRVAFGFDGYIDTFRTVVAERHDHTEYERLSALGEFGDRISRSADAGSSLSMEWTADDQSVGGHACHLSRAFATLGYEPIAVGMFGQPIADIFLEECAGCELISLGEPGQTDALEFDDGKLMLIERGSGFALDWEEIRTELGVTSLIDYLEGVTLLGIGYLADITQLHGIIDGLTTDVWPHLTNPPEHVLIDTGDLRTLDPAQIQAGFRAICRLEERTQVTLSANRYETAVLAETVGADDDDPRVVATKIRHELGITRFVSHTAAQSVVATEDDVSVAVAARVEEPVKTTSAGDHFNAGLALALLEGLEGTEAVTLGNAVASWFVRTGTQPTRSDLEAQLEWYATQLEKLE